MGPLVCSPGGGVLADPPRDCRVRPRSDPPCRRPELATVRGSSASRTAAAAPRAARNSLTKALTEPSRPADVRNSSAAPSVNCQTSITRSSSEARKRCTYASRGSCRRGARSSGPRRPRPSRNQHIADLDSERAAGRRHPSSRSSNPPAGATRARRERAELLPLPRL